MEQYQSSLRHGGRTLGSDRSDRMPERPKPTGIVEDLGSDFGAHHTRSKGKHQAKKSKNAYRNNRDSMDLSEESDDEIDFLSQSSSRGSSPSSRTTHLTGAHTSKNGDEGPDEILIDGEYHRFHPNYPPPKKPLPSFKKAKRAPSESLESGAATKPKSTFSAEEQYGPVSVKPLAHVDAASRPKHKVLGMRPIHNRPETRPRTPSIHERDLEETPRPTKCVTTARPYISPKEVLPPLKSSSDNVGGRNGKAKAQDFPMDVMDVLENAWQMEDDGSTKEGKGGARARVPPLTEKSNAAPRHAPKPFPMMVSSGSQDSTRSEPLKLPSNSLDLSPVAMSKSSPPLSRKSSQQSSNGIMMRSRKKSAAQRARILSSSEEPGSSDDDARRVQKKHQPKPFPMAYSQVISPGKREPLDENVEYDREFKRVKGADEMVAEIMSSMDEDEDEDLLFIDPNVDPSTLCPWCDEPLPPAPSPHLEALIGSARKQSYSDSRPTNPLGLYAAPTVFVNVCQRHRFESVQIPLAIKRGWPTHIDWSGLSKRVRRLRNELQKIVDDVDEDFLPGRERSEEEDLVGDNDKDALDDPDLLKIRPRKGSAFWKEVVKGVRNKGSRQASGVRGQMSNFSKTQPGYYGELGYVIISQTIYDLFPPTDFEHNATLPLTPAEFIQRILVPETAVALVMVDLQQPREAAIKTLRDSASYGVAMFPDDHAEGVSMNAGEQIIQKRAVARRKELEKEEREEKDLWATFSEPPSGSEQATKRSSRANSQAPSESLPSSSQSSRPRRQCAGRTYAVDSSDSGSDVGKGSDDAAYAPSKAMKPRSARSKAGSSAPRAPKGFDTESSNTAEFSVPTPHPSRPKPRPRQVHQPATDTESAGEALESDRSPCSSKSSVTRTVTSGVRGRRKVTVQQDELVEEKTPKTNSTKTWSQRSTNPSQVFPLQLVRDRHTSSGSGGASKTRREEWSYSLRDVISEDDMSPEI